MKRQAYYYVLSIMTCAVLSSAVSLQANKKRPKPTPGLIGWSAGHNPKEGGASPDLAYGRQQGVLWSTGHEPDYSPEETAQSDYAQYLQKTGAKHGAPHKVPGGSMAIDRGIVGSKGALSDISIIDDYRPTAQTQGANP